MSLQELEISERIHIMETYYDLNALLEDRIDNQSIATYYKHSDFFYNLIHSHGGHSIHMALSDDGFFKKSDFSQQAKFIGEYITDSSIKILEVGAGKLYNTKYLAKSFPNNQFTAMDLPNRNFLKSRVPKNVSLMEGDFNDLSIFPENSFDIVFGVETVCHAKSKKHVLGEIHRVLKPGGKIILFDGYDARPQDEMSDIERRASRLTWAAMRVPFNDIYVGDMRRYFDELLFKDVSFTDLSVKIRPTLRKLDRTSCYYYTHPRLMKLLRRFISEDVTMNSIAGWLMLLTFDGTNIHKYCRIIATK
jgi:ubiquinone/menaquinone biosynthesis C-methylase UbiE